MAARFNLLGPKLDLLLNGLKRAPKPALTELTEDWVKNLDVITHAMGCVIVGAFDDVVEDIEIEELKQISAKEFSELLPPGFSRTLMENSFEICRSAYLEYGSLVALVESGKLKPEGLVTQALLAPIVKKRAEQISEEQPVPKIKRLMGVSPHKLTTHKEKQI
jgi:hypothetical protein